MERIGDDSTVLIYRFLPMLDVARVIRVSTQSRRCATDALSSIESLRYEDLFLEWIYSRGDLGALHWRHPCQLASSVRARNIVTYSDTGEILRPNPKFNLETRPAPFVPSSWVAKYVRNMKHFVAHNAYERRNYIYRVEDMAHTLAPYLVHQSLQSLVNIHLTPEIASEALRLLNEQTADDSAAIFKNLLHVTVEMREPTRDTRRDRDDESPPHEIFAEFLSKCPSLTSLGMKFRTVQSRVCHSSRQILSRQNALMFPFQENLISFSIDMAFDGYFGFENVVLAFPKDACFDSVRNLRVCSNCTDAFLDHGILERIYNRFPKVSFLYLGFRDSCIYEHRGWCGTGAYHREFKNNEIDFPENIKSSLKTLALDECFFTQQNVEKLGTFEQLDKVIVAVLDATDYPAENGKSMDNLLCPERRPVVRTMRVAKRSWRVSRTLKGFKKKLIKTFRHTDDDDLIEASKVHEEKFRLKKVEDYEYLPRRRKKPFDLDCAPAHRHIVAEVCVKEMKLSTIWPSLCED